MIKIVTGEVIMGKQLPSEDGVLIEKPFALIMDPMQGGVGMMPYNAIYTQSEPEKAIFKEEHIVERIDIHETFEEAYIKQTTGIETAAPSIEV